MLRNFIHNKKFHEIVRFVIVGGIATLLQVVLYYLLTTMMSHNWALFISYAISLIVNFLFTIFFTFQVKPSATKGAGFLTSHAINFTLQFVLINLFIYIGIGKQIAIIPVLAICIPVNFLLVRLSIKKL